MGNDTESTGPSYDERGKDDEALEQARGRAEQEKARAGETVEHLAGATRAAADDLEQRGDTQIADLARNAASQFSTFADSLHNRNADELVRDARRLAQTNPAMFIGGSVAIGFALSRLFRASSADQTTRSQTNSSGYAGSTPTTGSANSNPSVSDEPRR